MTKMNYEALSRQRTSATSDPNSIGIRRTKKKKRETARSVQKRLAKSGRMPVGAYRNHYINQLPQHYLDKVCLEQSFTVNWIQKLLNDEWLRRYKLYTKNT